MNKDFTVKVLFDVASHYKTYHNVADVYTKDALLCIRFKHNHDDVDDVVHKYPLDKIFRLEHEYDERIDSCKICYPPLYSIPSPEGSYPPLYTITTLGDNHEQSK